MTPHDSILRPLLGRRMPGGCDDCDAYQVLSRLPDDQWGHVFFLAVHHDDTCPHLNEVTC